MSGGEQLGSTKLHGTQRSFLPGRPAVQAGAGLGSGFRRRIEEAEKARVCVIVEKESALIKDSLLSLPPGALEHEFRQFLTAQRCCPIENGLRFRRRTDLDHIVL